MKTILFTVYRGAIFGMIKEAFPEQQLFKANSLLAGTRNIGMLVGPSLLSFLLVNKNWNLPFFIDSATHFVSAALLLNFHYIGQGADSFAATDSHGSFESMIKGIFSVLNLKILFFLERVFDDIGSF